MAQTLRRRDEPKLKDAAELSINGMTNSSPGEAGSTPRELACGRCGTRFECRLGGGCWCNDVDARLPMPAAGDGEDCLCPACLRAAAQSAATTEQR